MIQMFAEQYRLSLIRSESVECFGLHCMEFLVLAISVP